MDAWSDQSEIKKKISEIEERSANGEYIYRGEPEYHEKPPYCGKVSSNLWRELEVIKAKYSDIKSIQAELLAEARAYYQDGKEEYEILTDLQHYGGRTNLIDFTTDYNVALFFACYGSPGEDGRVIILQETEEIKELLSRPLTPEIRVRAQKSVFVEPLKGYIKQKYEVVCIPKDLKLRILQYLQTDHGINPKIIYNDIHGFIRSQNAYWMAYREFYNGFISQNNAGKAKSIAEEQIALEKAIKHYTNALDLNLQLPAVYYNLGLAHYSKQEYDRAVDDFTKATGLKSDYADAYNSRGVVYQMNGDNERAIKDHNRAIQLKSGYVEAYTNRGIAYKSKGEIDRAIKDYNKAIELKHDYAHAYANRGYAFHSKGDFDRAITDYNKAIKVNPHLADAYFSRGSYYDDKGDFDRAIEDYNKAIELKPDYAKAYNNRGMAYYSKEGYGCAIKDFTKATEINPNNADAYYNRGNAHVHRGEAEQAILDYNRAIELRPDYASAYSNRGVAYYSTKEYERAIEDFIKAIELKPDDPEVYFNRGVALGDRGYHERAILDYSKTIELRPHHIIAYYNRGVAYYRMGEYVRAIEDYSTAIELKPDFREAYDNRGEAWLHLKEWEKAKADLMTAKKLGVDIVAAFRNDYKNIAAFERANQVKLPEDIAALVRQGFRNRYPRKGKALNADGKPFEFPEVLELRETLRHAGTPLGEYVKVQPYFGVNTAPTEVFVVDGNTRDKLIAEHPSSEEILKPFLHGRNIRRWQVEPPEQWLIFAYRGIEINAYPAIRNYLEKHQESLSKRKGKGEWYELRASVKAVERYAGPKLVCPNLYNTQTFAIETEGFFCGSSCCIIPTAEKWLCGLLNTRTVEWFYSQISDQLGPGQLQARSVYIKQIPVPDLNAEQKNLVRKIVEYLIYLQNQPTTSGKDLAHARDFLMLKYFERIINGLVYEFYMPDVLQSGNRDLFKHLMAEQLLEVKEFRGDKMSAFRALYERMHHKEHPVRVNLFFQDSLRPIRIIEDKW